ncbi:MAG TPA: hypothetical protein VJC39_00320 [Candidatus Nanoarchaeia archaeon]|nr:hypothetical protein [Candidatus Nanoarchaeia archaeon]
MEIGKLITYLLALLVLVILGMFLYLDPGTGYVKITKGFGGILNTLPSEEQDSSAFKLDIPADQRSQIDTLKDTIELMLKSSKKNCFANYGGFGDLGERGISLTLTYDPAVDSTKLRVLGGEGGEQVITNLLYEFKGMKPCVVAGGIVAENFRKRFITQENTQISSVYNPINELTIYYETESAAGLFGLGLLKGATCSNGNRIIVPEFGEQPVNDECNNLREGGFLFKPSSEPGSQHICFFPTNTEFNANEDGQDWIYISGEESQGIKSRYAKDELVRC